ncbi:hypothetical protein [Limnohabitans sp.]|uniref:hypothetical protein n=1 Tax=Limnohabitans sp. TaxID=1907725 RepID=UPI003340DEF8
MKIILNRLNGLSAALLLVLALSGCHLPLQTPDCPPGQSLSADQLVGKWTVQMAGSAKPWTLNLSPHPEHLGSLRGELRQGDQGYWVVADLEGREFTMEESHDGQRIAATWLGTAVHGHCGRWLEGERLATGQAAEGFAMRRAP